MNRGKTTEPDDASTTAGGKTKPNERLEVHVDEALLDLADALSFPASDPPAVTSISRRPDLPKQKK